jgi:DNA-binding NtrC family response regulator
VPPPAGGPRALVVEDMEEVCRFAATALDEVGLAAVVAASYDEALSALDERIMLVITDIDMPGRSGVELISAVCARPPELPIIAMTGNGLALGEASQARAHTLLLKPFALDELRTLVQLLALAPAAVENTGTGAVLCDASGGHGGREAPPSAASEATRIGEDSPDNA